MSEVKDIPKHWEVKQLGKVCDKISLNGIKIKQKDYLQEGKFPVVDQGQEVIGGYFNDEKLVVPAEPPYIIFGDHTKVKKYINFKFIAGADGVKVLKPHSIYNPKFFFYLIHTVKIPDKGYARHFQFLEKEQIPMPPLPEQQAIVAKIEELLSDLENGKQQLQTAQQQLKVYRQSLLKWAFEGKLTRSTLRQAQGTVTPVAAATEPVEVVETTDKNGELPKGWKIVELKEVCEIKRGKSKHRPRNAPSLFGGKYPFIQTGDIRNANGGYIKNSSQTYSEIGLQQSKLWAKGTLCITIAANIGETAILDLDACFPDSVVGLVCNEKFLLNKYTNYFFISHKSKLEELAPATAQKNINVDILEKVKIPLPSLREQQLIVDELESKLTVCDKIEETISQSLQQAETLRQSILKKAFEGKLVHG